jgi:hypothetical protein
VESRSTFHLGPTTGWALTLLLAVFAVAPLTYPGFFEAESGFLPAFRAAGLAPTWFGPADPLRGEGEMPYLLAWPVFQLSGSGVAAVKWGYGLSFLLGAWGIYAWLRRWQGSGGAILAAAVYTYLPWHLAAVYRRGAYGEAWLWAAWPWLLWAIDRLREGRPRSILAAAAVGLPTLVTALTSQPGLAALSLLLLASYGLLALAAQARVSQISSPRWRTIGIVLIMGVAAIILSLVARASPAPRVAFEANFLAPFQLLAAGPQPGESGGGFGPAVPGMGLAAAGLSLLAAGLWAGRGPREARKEGPGTLGPWLGFWAAVLSLILLLSLPLAAPLWRITGLQGFLTTPWQVLALAGLPLAFLAGSVVCLDARLATLPAWAGLLALAVLASYGSLSPMFTAVDPGPEPVAAFRPVDAVSAQILLLETEIAPPGEITPTLVLTLTWQAVEPVSADYTTFVHLLDGEGEKVAQRDGQPCNGECPTGAWQPGATVVDRYELSVPPGSMPGPYQLALGLYLLEDGRRAAVVGREDDGIVIDVPH